MIPFTPHAGAGYLDDVTLASARPGPGVPAPWVEACTCPAGYGGQFCETCLPGYRRETPSLGPYSPCVLCTCSGHSETCDPETGEKMSSGGRETYTRSGGWGGNARRLTRWRPCPCPHACSPHRCL